MHENIRLQPPDMDIAAFDVIQSEDLGLMPCLSYVAVTAVDNKRTLITGADGEKNHMTGRWQTVRRLLFKRGENALAKPSAFIAELLKITGYLHI